MEVTQAQFARMAGVSRPAVCGKIKKHTLIMNSAGMLDTDNPVNRSYLDSKQKKLQEQALGDVRIPAVEKTTPKNYASAGPVASQTVMPQEGSVPAAMLEMTLRQIVQNYGGMAGVERYVKILKDLTSADEKTQRLQERRLLQIPRDFVVSRLFGFLNSLTNKILDVPESLADQVIALVLADPDNCRQKIVNYTRDVLSRAIGGSKEKIIDELNSLKGKYDDTDELSNKIDEIYEQVGN